MVWGVGGTVRFWGKGGEWRREVHGLGWVWEARRFFFVGISSFGLSKSWFSPLERVCIDGGLTMVVVHMAVTRCAWLSDECVFSRSLIFRSWEILSGLTIVTHGQVSNNS